MSKIEIFGKFSLACVFHGLCNNKRKQKKPSIISWKTMSQNDVLKRFNDSVILIIKNNTYVMVILFSYKIHDFLYGYRTSSLVRVGKISHLIRNRSRYWLEYVPSTIIYRSFN